MCVVALICGRKREVVCALYIHHCINSHHVSSSLTIPTVDMGTDEVTNELTTVYTTIQAPNNFGRGLVMR